MSRQMFRDAALSAPARHRRSARDTGVRRLRAAAAGASAALAAGLLIGWNPPLSLAQQSPDTWSGDHRAVLPSGLTVRLDFSAAPGFAVVAAPGELPDRAGGGRAAALYTDGVQPGDSAQTFLVSAERPQTDGSWRTVGTLQADFSRPVRNPRLHLGGLAGTATAKTGSTATETRLTLTGGSPSAPTLVNRTDWPGWTVDDNTLAPAAADGGADPVAGSAAEGTLELAGTFRTAVFRVEQRSTARAGSTTPPEPLTQAYTVTLDEGVGTAPQNYGNASHLVSDLFLGADAGNQARRPGRASGAGPAGRSAAAAAGPPVRLDRGAAWPGVRANPAPPQLQPGRGEYLGADPSVSYPAEAAIGRDYRLTVPVAVGGAPATLAGWIDFDRNGRFDPTERVQSEVRAGSDTATLEWTVPGSAASGETWARLRIGRDPAQLVPPGGFADSGQVSDQRIRLTVGAARPEIVAPVDGTVLSDARPQVRGEGALADATVEVREGDTTLCRARAEQNGDWSCRPNSALGAGAHSLTPVETTPGGMVLRGEPVRITVKSTPPAAPVLTLPEYTNDPGLQLTGTGEPGSTVSVDDRFAGPRGGAAAELCSTAVRPDGGWSCLPVENLPDGRHQLTPTAVDAAGNRTPGQAVALVVDTVAPDRPVLTVPAAGETVRVARPKLAGRAEPGARVIVTARSGSAASAERIIACGATAAFDGSWTCTANRDLVDGEQWLVVTATDQAGNGTSADAVAVRVAAAVAPSPAAPTTPAASPAVPASPVAPTASASVSPTASTEPATPAAPAAPASAVASPTGAASSSPAAPTPASSSPAAPTPAATSPSPAPDVPSPAPSGSSASVPAPEPVLEPVRPGLFPITVPVAADPAEPAVHPSSAPSAPAASPGRARTSPGVTVTPSSSPSPSRSVSASAAAAPSSRTSLTPRPSPSPPASAGRPSGEAARALAAPPADPAAGATAGAEASQAAADRSRSEGWRGGLAGVLLLITGAGLITRRVFARGPGARRR
ncbi:Ig-like domain-containing protein [Kitasatospora sp. NPDC047058]|uniref:Ig-like domain-containing protein n=1 Tax=Kitasatospora sp. NPDC047058 TaxID=3155620 RepID=UPI0033E30EC3